MVGLNITTIFKVMDNLPIIFTQDLVMRSPNMIIALVLIHFINFGIHFNQKWHDIFQLGFDAVTVCVLNITHVVRPLLRDL